ncbi:MAG: hypothetical protein JSV80_17460 [Acidobacteriota bacterium]|nr:MAG: hypothetical protein JSV80_17460 [Acidobacteriota bacterium]
MRKLALISTVAIVAAASCLVALAGQPVDITRPAAADGTVSIEFLAGSVRVVGWDRAEVQVTGVLDDSVEEFDFSTSGSRTSIEIVPAEHSHRMPGETDLEIHIPSTSELDVETVSARISVKAVTGEISVESISGEIAIEGAVVEVDASTVSGSVNITADELLRNVSVESVSGTTTLVGPLSPKGSFDFETVSGKIEMRIPAGTSAEFDLETFSGEIDNEFGQKAERSSFLPAKSLSFSLGNGEAEVSIESFSGRIVLRKM